MQQDKNTARIPAMQQLGTVMYKYILVILHVSTFTGHLQGGSPPNNLIMAYYITNV
jgi:hypothetical protein